MEKGKFIALEGIDGSGKTTQIRRLVRRLEDLGVPCLATWEPTDRPVGALLRQAMSGTLPLDNRVIAALYAADRLDHLVNEEDGLCAALDRGITVVSDRYYFSSYAYQSVETDMEWIIGANSLSAELLRPTLTVFLDVPPEQAMERIRQNRDQIDLYETQERLSRTRAQYFTAFDRLKDVERVAVVDGSGGPDQVEERVWKAVVQHVPQAAWIG